MKSIFSHIYVEEKACTYPVSLHVLDMFPGAGKIMVGHYKDVFNRPNQSFRLQKQYPSLILAVKEGNYLYKGPDICQDFGNTGFYYTSTLLNCLYDCDYCYLQGMYPSAYMVAFVNTGDFFNAASSLDAGSYLTVSYDTDLLAFEGVIPYTSMWTAFAEGHKNTTIEIRTKSAGYNSISHLHPVDNVILAWTLSPGIIAGRYEKNTPSPDARLKAVKKALEDKWKVRLCFDPVLIYENWKEVYGSFLDTVFTSLPAGLIYDVGIGAFRMPSDYIKKIKKTHVHSDIIYFPYEIRDGTAAYPVSAENEIIDFIYCCISRYINKKRIFVKKIK